jgi:PEGA domain-containing protein
MRVPSQRAAAQRRLGPRTIAIGLARIAAALLIALPMASCMPAAAPLRPTVSLRLSGSPADATVVVDEENIGPLDYVAAHGVALPPGVHHVTIQAPGYFPWDREVEAKLGMAPIRFDVVLSPVPD